ncbi:MAG: hypothetical protein GXP02_10205 [Alphaproteobacteria bacterium]|nr:hypothetical protein [Alphaproteobacteria bacterium]
MSPISVTCPVCGAKIPDPPSAQGYACCFCGFERRYDPQSGVKAMISGGYLTDIPQLLTINPVAEIYLETARPPALIQRDNKYPVTLITLSPDYVGLKAVWSDMMLPLQEDPAAYFRQKFHQLAPGGLLYLSTPVKRRFRKRYPLSAQINFFTSGNIMFLLEQHGFKLLWRKDRFAPLLRIIARK